MHRMTLLEHRLHELTVGQLAERSGVAVSALHFYESKGLISSRRTAGNQRRFTRDTLRRVSFIKVSQRVGIPLSEIKKALVTLPEERTPTVEDWARLSEAWRADLDARIEQLQRLRNDLTDCIGCGCLSINKCALANPYDQLGDEGSGPRRLLVENRRAAGPPRPATTEKPTEDAKDAGGTEGRRTSGEAESSQTAMGTARVTRVPEP
jgi:MerR family transcriptional regulator, redox-sensitive transcriptional activator SoxR